MSENQDIQAWLEHGIASAKSGDKAGARTMLEKVLRVDTENELAWIWMASVTSDMRARRACLERVLRINPNNHRAREALNALVGVGTGGDFSPERVQSGAAQQSPTSFADRFLNGLTGILVGIAGVVVVGLVFLLLNPAPETVITATQAPSATPILFTQTPSLTPTFPGVQIGMDERTAPTLPPTFTPTPTETPIPTQPPSPTALPASEFNLLMVARPGDAPQGTMRRLRADGSDPQTLVNDVREAAYSADGRFIFFVQDFTHEPDETFPEPQTAAEVFVAPSDNPANARRLTTLRTADAYQIAPAPDGGQVVFTSTFGGHENIFLYDLTTELTTTIAETELSERDPHWSPDGRTLLFSSDRESPGFFELYLYDFFAPSDEAVTRLTNTSGNSYHGRFSPDGTQIVFVNDRTGVGDVYITNRQGTRTLLLMGASRADDRRPVWSPDGRTVAFISNRQDDRFQVYITDLQGNITRIQNDELNAVSIDFQPDARFSRASQR